MDPDLLLELIKSIPVDKNTPTQNKDEQFRKQSLSYIECLLQLLVVQFGSRIWANFGLVEKMIQSQNRSAESVLMVAALNSLDL